MTVMDEDMGRAKKRRQSRQGSNLQPLGSEPSALSIEPRGRSL